MTLVQSDQRIYSLVRMEPLTTPIHGCNKVPDVTEGNSLKRHFRSTSVLVGLIVPLSGRHLIKQLNLLSEFVKTATECGVLNNIDSAVFQELTLVSDGREGDQRQFGEGLQNCAR